MITSNIPNQATVDFLSGVHLESDTYKIALFTDVADIDETTSVYDATGESVGVGYPAAGWALSGAAFVLQGSFATISFATLTKLGLSLSADGFMIYNASRSNKIITVQRFGLSFTASNQSLRLVLDSIIELVK